MKSALVQLESQVNKSAHAHFINIQSLAQDFCFVFDASNLLGSSYQADYFTMIHLQVVKRLHIQRSCCL